MKKNKYYDIAEKMYVNIDDEIKKDEQSIIREIIQDMLREDF